MSHYSESFIDSYGTTVTVRKLRAEDTHVQLLLSYADGSEPTSYGFADDDFARFADNVVKLAEAVGI